MDTAPPATPRGLAARAAGAGQCGAPPPGLAAVLRRGHRGHDLDHQRRSGPRHCRGLRPRRVVAACGRGVRGPGRRGGGGRAPRIREHSRLGHLFASWVDAHPDFERLAPTPFSVVCFRARPTDLPVGPEEERDAYFDALNERLLDAVNATGRAYLSHTRLRGRFAVRLAVGNLRTTEAHLQTAWDLLQEHAARLHAAGRGGAQEKAEAPWKG